jgi:hypothetical protein
MKYLGIRNLENGINLIQILPIFGHMVFMPGSYYFSPISRYNNNCPLWVQIEENQYEVFSITDAGNWMEDLGSEIRRRYNPNSGFVFRNLKRNDLYVIFDDVPNNLNYTHSIVEERYDGVLSAYLVLSNEPIPELNKTPKEEGWRNSITRKIVKYKGDSEKLESIILVMENEYSHSHPDYSVIWYKSDNMDEKQNAINRLHLLESDYGFLFWQLS